jgi:hypothetical protein
VARRPANRIAAVSNQLDGVGVTDDRCLQGGALLTIEAGLIEGLAQTALGEDRLVRRQPVQDFGRVAQPGNLGRLVGPRNLRPVANDLLVFELAARVVVLRYKPAFADIGLQAETGAKLFLERGPANIQIICLSDKMPVALARKIRVHRAGILPKPVASERARADKQMRERVIFLPVDRLLHRHTMFLRLDFLGDERKQQLAALVVRTLARQGDGEVLRHLAALLPTHLAGRPVYRLLGALGLAPYPRRIRRPFRCSGRQDQAMRHQLVGTVREVEPLAALVLPSVPGNVC